MANGLEELITTEDREAIEAAVQGMCEILIWGTMVCENITEFIDARIPDHEAR